MIGRSTQEVLKYGEYTGNCRWPPAMSECSSKGRSTEALWKCSKVVKVSKILAWQSICQNVRRKVQYVQKGKKCLIAWCLYGDLLNVEGAEDGMCGVRGRVGCVESVMKERKLARRKWGFLWKAVVRDFFRANSSNVAWSEQIFKEV